ncbi:PAS domain S-box-containing protein [Mariniphaga anaerophila]|uniref:PAS domain S-box-containing protein n=1 Tax=Mariniphaga anaerophila TaxID=1484053 RepID=A0A1M4VJ51_9BACT|nr:PAS domain-containing protein [Mariniphaga anaerophila]SHE68893.1 PAS domain S-box-containing protein [Mariniphaga anaerophila]
MTQDGKLKNDENRIRDLETQISAQKFELEKLRTQLAEEQEKSNFYQLVADFAFDWELWFEPSGKIKYCSPSCNDLTGFTANQIISAGSVAELLVFGADREKFDEFLSGAFHQLLVNPSHEFRILTRSRQLRWCSINVRGVYDRKGRYLGIRAAIHDITKLKKALGHINELATGNELGTRNRQWLKSELEIKERELVGFLLQLSQKNELINRVSRQLKEMTAANASISKKKIENVLDLLQKSSGDLVDWNMVEVQLEKVYPGFLSRLQSRHPQLTRNDNKLSACLRLGLTSREIAGLRNHTPQSVEIARVRLRKKLKLPHEIRLVNYLSEI